MLSALIACAQSKSLIKNSYGFFVFQYPGNVPVDENGNVRPGFRGDTTYTVYLESSKNNIVWDTAYIGNQVYSVLTTPVQANQVEAGQSKNDKQKIIIKPHHGNQLFNLDFILIDGAQIPNNRKVNHPILLIGIYNGKRIELSIEKLIELYTPDAV